MRESDGLARSDSLHAVAFYLFQQGDYSGARQSYRDLLERDPSDPYAWLLLGALEFDDVALEVTEAGALRPRRSLNRAMAAFTEALRLSPGFHLGYGQVFDITRRVVTTAEGGQGWGYRRPGTELIGPWERTDPTAQVAFYPVYTDSIALLDEPTFDAMSREDVGIGANRLVDRSTALLRRWAAFAPTEPRPLEELVNWTLRRREALSGTTRREDADSLAAAALNDVEAALTLKTDTVPSELVRLAGLHLSLGDLDRATADVDRALQLRAEDEGIRIGRGAVNVRLRRGDVSGAIEIIEFENHPVRYFGDPSQGGLFGDLGVAPIVARIQILGATGTGGATLAREFEALDALWRAEYTRDRLETLRSYFSPGVTVGLLLDEAARANWASALQAHPWALFSDSTSAISGAIESALSSPDSIRGAEQAYLLGLAAQRAGAHGLATRAFQRLDSLVYRIEARDLGWGLQPLSWFLRAESHEALGETALAVEAYQRFLDAWSVDDPLTAARRDSARAALARIGSAG